MKASSLWPAVSSIRAARLLGNQASTHIKFAAHWVTAIAAAAIWSLPELLQWREQTAPSIGVWDYLGAQSGSITHALAFAHLFWPDFVEVRGCVLLAQAYYAANFELWWQELAGDRRRTEQVINHVRLYDLFTGDQQLTPAVTESALAELGEILIECWSCALTRRFPDRKFHVELRSGEPEYGPTIYFSTAESRIA